MKSIRRFQKRLYHRVLKRLNHLTYPQALLNLRITRSVGPGWDGGDCSSEKNKFHFAENIEFLNSFLIEIQIFPLDRLYV